MNTTVGGMRGGGAICTREQKQNKTKQTKNRKNTPVRKLCISIGYFKQMLLVIGYIGGKVNSLTGLSRPIFRLIQVKSIVEDESMSSLSSILNIENRSKIC